MSRTVFSTTATGIINELCKLFGAKIVTNSAHNYHHSRNNNNLKQDLISVGNISADYFHKDWRTQYPFDNTGSDFLDNLHNITHPRMRAIQQWQEKNGNVDWICFDDDKFTDNNRLFHVDFDEGITFNQYRAACVRWSNDVLNTTLIIPKHPTQTE
jgi:hypothetical protein